MVRAWKVAPVASGRCDNAAEIDTRGSPTLSRIRTATGVNWHHVGPFVLEIVKPDPPASER